MATMNKRPVKNPIAERRLAVVGDPDREIVITIGKPRPEPDPSVWRCSFRVDGIPNSRRWIARGVDSLQALQNAIEAARYQIKLSGLVCTWHGGEPGEIGLPRSIPTYEGSGFAERMERYVDREEAKVLRGVLARKRPNRG